MSYFTTQAQFVLRGYLSPNLASFKLSKDYQDDYTSFTSNGYRFRRKFDFGGGVGVGLNLNQVLLLAEIGFTQKTISSELIETVTYTTPQGEVLSGQFNIEQTLQFIPVNIISTIKILGEERAVTLTVGPSFNFGLQGNSAGTFETDTQTIPIASGDITMGNSRFDNYKRLDFGFLLGIGGVIPINSNFQLFADIRTRIGLSNMYSAERKNYLETNNIIALGNLKTRGTTFNIGINYTLDFF